MKNSIDLRWFIWFTLAAIVLRLFFIIHLPVVAGDGLLYGDIAKNWLQHGVYGITDNAAIRPTYIRLPGYPAFLAFIFLIFGVENYQAALLMQMVVDVASCFVIAMLTFALLSPDASISFSESGDSPTFAGRAARMSFALAALCPFLANYVATTLTETWSIFLTALSLCLAVRALRSMDNMGWALTGIAIGVAILFRPDNGLLLAVIGGTLIFLLIQAIFRGRKTALRILRAGLMLGAVVALALLPWTLRNWRTMHRFQPLAPRFANDPNEFAAAGFSRWERTWIVDFSSVENFGWRVTGEPVDIALLPPRALDSEAERQRTQQLFSEYNQTLDISPALDGQFNELASQRIRRHRLRYYLWLPLLRIADMWLRPRIEFLPIAGDWWRLREHSQQSAVALGMGAMNLFFLIAAWVGFVKARRSANFRYGAVLIAFVLVRSAFLGSIESPEPRYVLECYPVVLAFAGMGLAAITRENSKQNSSQ